MRRAVFAIPGDLDTVTGGYLYEKRLLLGLRELGTETEHLRLGPSFPDPTTRDHADALDAMTAIDDGRPLILDGFVFGSIEGLEQVRAPVVGMVHHPLAHEEGLEPSRREHLMRTERENVRLAAHVLVPSPHTARVLISEYGADADRITIARPGTDRPAARGGALSGHASTGDPLILSIGIQHPRKGHDVLLRALAQVIDLPWQAVVAGHAHDPGHAQDLQRLRRDLGLTRRVRLAGKVPTPERDDLLSTASIFALATRYEGYGLVFDEALAHGVPIVSCRTGAVPDTVPADAGVLVPPDDPDAFAAALRSMLQDPGARAARASAARRAGAQLPTWLDTAATAQAVLDRLS